MSTIELGALVRVALEGRVVARDEMGDSGYLVEYRRDGEARREWLSGDIVERVMTDGDGI